MKEHNSETNAASHATITIKRTFNLPLKTLWKAWSEPESMKKWWGPAEYSCADCIIDFKVGGRILASMQGPDGKKIWSTGTYQEIVPLKKIVNTDNFADSNGNVVPASYYNMSGNWDQELLVTVEFEESGDQSTMTLTHAGVPADQADDCKKGWQSSLDKLDSWT